MRLGARWQAGENPHRGVPPVLYSAISDIEQAHPDASAWTLTWLEDRPRCALDHVALVTLDSEGVPKIIAGSGSPEALSNLENSVVEDDDDWLL